MCSLLTSPRIESVSNRMKRNIRFPWPLYIHWCHNPKKSSEINFWDRNTHARAKTHQKLPKRKRKPKLWVDGKFRTVWAKLTVHPLFRVSSGPITVRCFPPCSTRPWIKERPLVDFQVHKQFYIDNHTDLVKLNLYDLKSHAAKGSTKEGPQNMLQLQQIETNYIRRLSESMACC